MLRVGTSLPLLVPSIKSSFRSTALHSLICTKTLHSTIRTKATQSASVDMVAPAIEGLEPQSLWKFFNDLSAIPRPSKQEERVLEWLRCFANERGLSYQQDSVGNLVIRRPGTSGGEHAPSVIIQGHVDMVTEKNADTVHDFTSDGITLVRDGDWITADGTTLGADNGIGVCAALAVLDMPASVKLPPIEALFTIDEETGLTGAFELDGSLLQGRMMLNLDTEDWGEVFIGCAGGGDSVLTLKCGVEKVPAGQVVKEIKIEGLMGGHSGINIHEDRGNAVKMAAAVAESVLEHIPTAHLAGMLGGDKRNAIPRECTVTVSVPESKLPALEVLVSSCSTHLLKEYGTYESSLSISCKAPKVPANNALLPADATRLITLLSTLPHGVLKFSHAVPGLVESSTNLASVRPLEEGTQKDSVVQYRIQCSTRSSLSAPLERCRKTIRKLGELVGADVEQDKAYPGWEPQPNSEIVGIVRDAIGKITGEHPPVKAIHAGLECGIIGEKLPGVQSVSYGPTIRGAHSPDERVKISTVAPFFDATLKVLEILADRKV